MQDLRRLIEAVRPRSASIVVEGKVPGYLEVRAEADGTDAPIPEFETQGHIRETPSGFESSGSFNVEREAPEERHEVRLLSDTTEDRTHVLEGTHLVPAGTAVAALFSSVEGVRGFVEMVLGWVSERLRDVFEFEVKSHSAETKTRDRKDFLDTEYTVRLRGPSEMRIEKGEVAVSRGDGLACSWEFDVRNHGGFFAELIEEEGYGHGAETLLEARRLSGFSETIEWEAALSDRDAVAEIEYESENGSGYVEKLQRSGLDTPEEFRFGFELETSGTKTESSFEYENYETSTDPTEGLGERLGGSLVFLPFPVFFALVRLS